MRITVGFILIFVVLSCNNTVDLKKNYDVKGLRIVSLVPSISRELECLDVIDNIVGVTSYCNLAATNPNLIVGTAIDVNEEKVLLLKPDIVFASGLSKQSTIEALRKNGVAVHYLQRVQSFEDICSQFIELGKLVEKEEMAHSIVREAKEKVDSLKSSIVRKNSTTSVFFQIGTKPLFTVIPNTFMDDFITFSACENIAAGINKGTISREWVLKQNPDVIIIVTMGVLGAEEKKRWEEYRELSAVKNKNIYIIDSKKACEPGVIPFVETLEDLVSLLNLN